MMALSDVVRSNAINTSPTLEPMETPLYSTVIKNDNIELVTYPGGESNSTTDTELLTAVPNVEPHSIWEIIIISIVVTVLCIITAGGNLLVIISFKMNKQLQTVSNYFLCSLSVADFFIGVISMPLYTMFLLLDRWPLGPLICDIWLSLDYTMSNASVANLLIICFDRYFSVKRPLTYRAKRTPKRAAIMISLAWIISVLLWTPWIMAWPYIEGKRTVPKGSCEIQFLTTNQYITIITAFAAFYLPVIIMCVLYFKIYLETERRQRDLRRLQADRAAYHSRQIDSSEDDVYTHLQSTKADSSPHDLLVNYSPNGNIRGRQGRWKCIEKLKRCCRIDQDTDYADEDSSSDPPASPGGTPTSSMHTHSLHMKRPDLSHHHHHHSNGKKTDESSASLMSPLINQKSSDSASIVSPSTAYSKVPTDLSNVNQTQSLGSKPSLPTGSCKSDSDPNVYTILIKLPEEGSKKGKPSITMIPEVDDTDSAFCERFENREHIPMTTRERTVISEDPSELTRQDSDPRNQSYLADAPSVGSRLTQTGNALQIAMQARIAAKMASKVKDQRARKKRLEKKQDKKAAKTLSAILFAFIITWTPYNLFTVINVFCTTCIDTRLYALGYWLCYINSTVNPVCYALCNVNFRRTYMQILTCRLWKRKSQQRTRTNIRYDNKAAYNKR